MRFLCKAIGFLLLVVVMSSPAWARAKACYLQGVDCKQDGRCTVTVSTTDGNVLTFNGTVVTSAGKSACRYAIPSQAGDTFVPSDAVAIETLDPKHGSAPIGSWTPWLSRDRPSGSGDFETLQDFIAQGKACEQPQEIECRTVQGVDWREAGQQYVCDREKGGICQNAAQPEGARCQDYEVRFNCEPRIALRMVNYLCAVRVVTDPVDGDGEIEVVKVEGRCCDGWLCFGRTKCSAYREVCVGVHGVFDTYEAATSPHFRRGAGG